MLAENYWTCGLTYLGDTGIDKVAFTLCSEADCNGYD